MHSWDTPTIRSSNLRLNRRELGANLLKLFENLLQQIFVHNRLLQKPSSPPSFSERHVAILPKSD